MYILTAYTVKPKYARSRTWLYHIRRDLADPRLGPSHHSALTASWDVQRFSQTSLLNGLWKDDSG